MRSAIASMTKAAFTQQGEIVLVVGGADQAGFVLDTQRGGRQLLEVVDGTQRDAVLGTFLGRQVEQHDWHARVDEVGGDLRAHDAGTEHGDFLDDEIGHARSLGGERWRCVGWLRRWLAAGTLLGGSLSRLREGLG